MSLNRKFSKEETKMSKKYLKKEMFQHSQQLRKCKFKRLDFILLQSEKQLSTNKGQPNAGGDVRRENIHSLFVVWQNVAVTLEIGMKNSHKPENKSTIRPGSTTPWHMAKDTFSAMFLVALLMIAWDGTDLNVLQLMNG